MSPMKLTDSGSDGRQRESWKQMLELSPKQNRLQRQKVKVLSRLQDLNLEEVKLPGFEDQLWLQFNHLPVRYLLNVNVERAEDVVESSTWFPTKSFASTTARRSSSGIRMMQILYGNYIDEKHYATKVNQVLIQLLLNLGKKNTNKRNLRKLQELVPNMDKVRGSRGVGDNFGGHQGYWWWNREVQYCKVKAKKVAYKNLVKCADKEEKLILRRVYKTTKTKSKLVFMAAKTTNFNRLYVVKLGDKDGDEKLYRLVKAKEKKAHDLDQVKYMKDEED
ncbi:hypothetical protein H5410_005923 [Solanum commersonii]|uniref:Uncharacterized protein n=1 Tax=Solanum commersonii TaxID=4109 RepID=A0A9J6A876_SOLCO|nr:hypothetical protein H5410_005923 [Solanum commersonii]